MEAEFFVMDILDGVHLRLDLTHSFVYYSGYDCIFTDGTSCYYVIVFVRVGNETVGLNLTWAHNLFIGWALGFPTLGRSRHRNSK